MKTTYLIIAGLIFCLIFSSCKEQIYSASGMVPTNHYIQTYVNVKTLNLDTARLNQGVVSLTFSGDMYENHHDKKHAELSERYGDTHWGGSAYPGMTRAVCNDFIDIDVISDADFNGRPAGTSLKDVVKLLSSSAKKYIDGGYKDKFSWEFNMPADYGVVGRVYYHYGFNPVYGTLSSLTPDDLLLLEAGRGSYLVFTEQPVIKEHNFTVIFRNAKRAYRGGVKVVFGDEV